MTTNLRAAGTLLASDPGARRLTYRLLPYGEPGRTSLGLVTAAAGVIELPAAADLVLNLEHERRAPLGRGAVLAENADALNAVFEIAATRRGDDLLAEAAAGLRTGISVELDDVVIRGGQLVAGRLVGAGATVDPAFPSAQLVATDTPDPDPDTDDDDQADTDTDDDQDSDSTDNPADQGEDDDPDNDTDSTADTDSGADMTTTTTTPPAATVTASRAAAPAGLPANQRRPEPGYREIVRFLADRARQNMDGRLYAALADITPGSTSVNDITQVPQWLGELWDGRTYAQRYAPLLTQAPLTAMEIKGWRWTVKPEVGPYAGNKAEVPSNAASTEPYTLAPTRIAGAHDIDRIFRDFNVEEFWTSYWAAMTESYARQADSQTGAELVAEAPYVTPGPLPTGAPAAAAYIVDGALAIIDTAVPDFAIVAKDLYRELLLTPADQVLAYLNMALGLEDGTISSFRVVPGDAAFPAASVLVGARAAATLYQLPGTPIRVEALNIAQGGVDVGLFGYLAVGINDDAGLAFVSATDPRPPLADAEDAPARTRRGRARKAAE